MAKKRLLAMSALTMSAALALSGCAPFEDDAPDDVVYCVDADNVVVDQAKCDDGNTNNGGGGGSSFLFWYMMGPYQTGLSQGSKLDPSTATQRVPYNDSAARQKAGLSPTGKVDQVGKSVSGKSAGYGKSGGGSGGKSGGFGSGGSNGG